MSGKPGRSGRIKGSTYNKHTFTIMGKISQKNLEEIAKKYKKNKYGRTLLTPLDVMVDIMNDVNQKPSLRLQAAKDAAPFFHWQMPSLKEIHQYTEQEEKATSDTNITIAVMTPDTQQPEEQAPADSPGESTIARPEDSLASGSNEQ